MGLEYRLSELVEIEESNELKLELAPRNQCLNYVQENGGISELLEKDEFDAHYKNGDFVEGPFRETLGDGAGEPYNPNRQSFGKLKLGNVVYCELSALNQQKTKILLARQPATKNI